MVAFPLLVPAKAKKVDRVAREVPRLVLCYHDMKLVLNTFYVEAQCLSKATTTRPRAVLLGPRCNYNLVDFDI